MILDLEGIDFKRTAPFAFCFTRRPKIAATWCEVRELGGEADPIEMD